jgi:hypothetical protein
MEGTRQRKAYKITKQRVGSRALLAALKVPLQLVCCSKPKTGPCAERSPAGVAFTGARPDV